MNLTHLELAIKYLETYRGRDKIIRLFNYAFFIGEGFCKRYKFEDCSDVFAKLASQFSNTRVMLRLFDDLSMLAFNISTKAGLDEKDSIIRITSVIDNVLGQLYYPIEHLAWARDSGIFGGNSAALWLVGVYIWFLSISVQVIKSVRRLLLIHSASAKENTPDIKNRGALLSVDQKFETVNIIGSLCDAVCAINWMQPGILWSGKLPADLIGLFGVTSSCCSIYKSIT